jgi:hypothetical protein
MLAVIATAAAAFAVAAAASSPKIAVKPSHGGTKSRFKVSFVAPDTTSITGVIRRTYTVQATNARSRAGCTSEAAVSVTNAVAGSRVRVKLARTAGPWCRGTFHGRIDEFVRPMCGPPVLAVCPMFMSQLRRVGTFKFHVR